MNESILTLLAVANEKILGGFRWPLLVGVIACIVSMSLTPLIKRLAFKYGAVDDPKRDDRRVHREPLPRWGGIAMYGGFLLSLLAVLPFAYPGRAFPLYVVGILGIGGLVVVVGALDDLHQFSAKIQLGFLLLAGVAIQYFSSPRAVQIQGISWPPGAAGHWIAFGLWAVPLTAIYIFVVSKTMDTIDGIDGLASGIAAISASALVIIAVITSATTDAAIRGEQPRVALLAAALAGASLGFIRHNYNPATIIMGTGGAQLLGFVLASLSIVGAMKTAATMAILIPLFVFGVPLFDAVQVVIRRRMSGVPITQPDKRHIHHQLLERGLSQRQAVWVLYSAAIVLSGLLVVAVRFYG